MTMQVLETALKGVKIFTPKKHGDHRGFFSETYNQKTFADAGVNYKFVQDNQSFSAEPFTFRGLHYQEPPHTQAKLVRILRGAALDIVVDLRKGSPTYLKNIMVELNPENWTQILVPEGFAHGILTLKPDTEVFYKVSDFYAPQSDRGVLWSDPKLNLQLPVDAAKLILSDKDKNLPLLNEDNLPFVYRG